MLWKQSDPQPQYISGLRTPFIKMVKTNISFNEACRQCVASAGLTKTNKAELLAQIKHLQSQKNDSLHKKQHRQKFNKKATQRILDELKLFEQKIEQDVAWLAERKAEAEETLNKIQEQQIRCSDKESPRN